MYKLLIVDDETYILDWLYHLFKENEELDLDIYTARSGSKAWEIINKTRIDIVLTDINMPGMSGLQLLNNVRRNWPGCKVIFLTGMSQFDYVYEAIQYSEVKYLLKTEKDEKIVEAVARTIKEIDDSIELERILNDSKKQVEEAKPLMRKEFLLNLLYGAGLSEGSELFRQLDIPLDPERPVSIILCAIENIPAHISYSHKNRLIFAVKLLVDQNMPECFSSIQTVDDQFHMLWFIQRKNTDPCERLEFSGDDGRKAEILLKGALEKVQDICADSLALNVSFLLSDEEFSLDEAPGKYAQLKSMLFNSRRSGNEIILFKKEYRQGQEEAGADKHEALQVRLAGLKAGQSRILENYLEAGQKEQFQKQLSSIIEGLREIQSRSCLPAVELYNSIALIFLSYLNRRNLADRIENGPDLQKLASADGHDTWSAAVDYLYRIQEEIFRIRDFTAETQAMNEAAQIRQYIDNNLDKDLSLIRLADIFHFNSSYLSRLFKAGLGINLSDYIFNKRIEQGKRLLEENRLKVHEIALAVGYDSPKSFARLFKKSQGVTPQEYRNSYLPVNNMSIPDT